MQVLGAAVVNLQDIPFGPGGFESEFHLQDENDRPTAGVVFLRFEWAGPPDAEGGPGLEGTGLVEGKQEKGEIGDVTGTFMLTRKRLSNRSKGGIVS
ncbi:unnamed protein product [Darwinula stevensoni]|uniref:Uncharacterized protein n=1 Tax=Darwinula stevensoni TaxID=69355 RepID=A0A7R9AH02_9CRUS|nr:unnamed protein product [Darwinula stevensoni]CAG0903944.1 unnamed protein product [Darwinula stevensoni]